MGHTCRLVEDTVHGAFQIWLSNECAYSAKGKRTRWEAQHQPEKGVIVTTTSRRRLRKAPLLFAAAISALLLTAGLAAAGAPALAAPAAPAAPAATVSAMAPGMMAVHGATAVPVDQTTKGQVSPDFTCESGYGGWYVHTDSTNFWLWIGTDESSYVVSTALAFDQHRGSTAGGDGDGVLSARPVSGAPR